MQRGYNGEVGWSTDPAVGPRVLTGRELDETRSAADFYADLYAASDYSSMSVVRRETFEGHDCFTAVARGRLRIAGVFRRRDRPAHRRPHDEHVDDGQRRTSSRSSASIADFGGILVPISATQRALGVESLLTVEHIAHDTVRDEELRPPAAILALIKGLRAEGSRRRTWGDNDSRPTRVPLAFSP